MPQFLSWSMAALCIAVLYYLWRDGIMNPARRKKVMRERVAYLLWCAANQSAA